MANRLLVALLLLAPLAARASQPQDPATVDLQVPAGTAGGGAAVVHAVVTANVAVTGAQLVWTVDGATPVAPPSPVVLGSLAEGAAVTIDLQVVLPAVADVTVAAHLTATRLGDDTPFTIDTEICLLLDANGLEVGPDGCVMLRFDRLERALDDTTDWTDIENLQHALGGGAEESDTPLSGEVTPRLLPGFVTVEGRIAWKDADGGIHPAPWARVEIRDDQPGHLSQVLTTLTTDDDGRYFTVLLNYDGPSGGGLDLFIRAYPSTANGSQVLDRGGHAYFIDSAIRPNVPDGSVQRFNLTAATALPSHLAFSVAEAIQYGEAFVVKMTGAVPRPITVTYPALEGSFFTWPDPGAPTIELRATAALDWDVILHEYGHFIADRRLYDLAAEVGGEHSFEGHLSEIAGSSKQNGIALAWSEGLATYLSIAAQRVLELWRLGIPNVGDTRYTSKGHGLDYDLELRRLVDGGGEDVELSVMRILWDLSDDAVDLHDVITLGFDQVWGTLATGKPHTLSDAWGSFVRNRTILDSTVFGGVFADHLVAPDPTAPANGSVVGPTTVFRWLPNGGGPAYPLNRFRWQLYSRDFKTLLFQSPELTAPMYAPSPADREILRKRRGVWLVQGRNVSSPTTGTYASPLRSIEMDPCEFDTNDDGIADLELPDPSGEVVCTFPPGKTVLKGTLHVRGEQAIQVSGKTIIEADAIVVDPGGRLIGTADTLRDLTLVSLKGDLESHGTLAVDASDDVTLRALTGSLRLDGDVRVTAPDRLQLGARIGSVEIAAVPTPGGFAFSAGNRIDVTAPGATGSIVLDGVTMASRRITLDTRAAVSNATAKQLVLRNGTRLSTDTRDTGLAGASDVSVYAVGRIGVDRSSLVSGHNVRVQSGPPASAICLSDGSTLAARSASGAPGQLYLVANGGAAFDDGTTVFGGVLHGAPAIGVCP